MENVVLGLLIIQSLTLYDLNRAFKQGISLFYSASYGSLQIVVKNLLGKGMIIFDEKVEKGRNKKVYSITELGRGAFYHWMFDGIPAGKLEVTALSKVYFLGLVEDAGQKKRILQDILAKVDIVENELNVLNGEISRYEVPEAYREILKYQLKSLDYGIQAHGFARAWFQGLLNELEAPADSIRD